MVEHRRMVTRGRRFGKDGDARLPAARHEVQLEGFSWKGSAEEEPGVSVLFLADHGTARRIDLQFDVLASRIVGLGIPDAVLVVDVVDVGVAAGG